jgi:hypothetical protein
MIGAAVKPELQPSVHHGGIEERDHDDIHDERVADAGAVLLENATRDHTILTALEYALSSQPSHHRLPFE